MYVSIPTKHKKKKNNLLKTNNNNSKKKKKKRTYKNAGMMIDVMIDVLI